MSELNKLYARFTTVVIERDVARADAEYWKQKYIALKNHSQDINNTRMEYEPAVAFVMSEIRSAVISDTGIDEQGFAARLISAMRTKKVDVGDVFRIMKEQKFDKDYPELFEVVYKTVTAERERLEGILKNKQEQQKSRIHAVIDTAKEAKTMLVEAITKHKEPGGPHKDWRCGKELLSVLERVVKTLDRPSISTTFNFELVGLVSNQTPEQK